MQDTETGAVSPAHKHSFMSHDAQEGHLLLDLFYFLCVFCCFLQLILQGKNEIKYKSVIT